jgi:glycosyltransferase involved in cell wall biosynthesis
VGWRYDRFFENVPIDEMKSIYSSCDILLKMSRVEGFFGPPMEAMACDCAVVVGKVTGYDEYIVNGDNALVVEQGDISGAQKAVKRLMDDSTLREKLIMNGYKTAKEWNWDHSIDLLEKVIVNIKRNKLENS